MTKQERFRVRLYYNTDKKNYHMNPLNTRKCDKVYVTANTFLELVKDGLVYTR